MHWIPVTEELPKRVCRMEEKEVNWLSVFNWIPVSKKLPPQYDDLMLTLHCNDKFYMTIFGYFVDGKYYSDDNIPIETETVTAWMLRPQPYKGE